MGMSNDEIIRLVLETDGQEGLKDLEEKLRHTKKGFEDVGASAEETSARSKATGRAFLDLGRAFQDFAQGGVGGVLNNLEGLGRSFSSLKDVSVAALTGPSGIAGMLTLVGTAAYVAFPYVRDFVKGIVDGANEIPKSTNALAALEEQLKKGKDRLEELAKQHRLTNTELAEYNRLTADSVRLTEEASRAKERQATLDKLRRGTGNRDPEVAENVQEALSAPGATARVEGAVYGSMRGRSGKIEALKARQNSLATQYARAKANAHNFDSELSPDQEAAWQRAIAGVQAQIQAEETSLQQQASATVADAAQGDAGALDRVLDNIPMDETWRQLHGATPGMLRAGDDSVAEAEAFGQRAHDAGVRRREKAGEGKSQGRAIDEMGESWAKEEERARDEAARSAREELGVVAAANAREKTEREHAEAMRKRDEEKAAREADPLNQLQKAREEERRRAAVAVQQANRMGGHNMNPDQVARATADAVEQLPFAGGNMDMAAQRAIGMGYQRLQEQMQQQARREAEQAAAMALGQLQPGGFGIAEGVAGAVRAGHGRAMRGLDTQRMRLQQFSEDFGQ